jgi:hypothetical protein
MRRAGCGLTRLSLFGLEVSTGVSSGVVSGVSSVAFVDSDSDILIKVCNGDKRIGKRGTNEPEEEEEEKSPLSTAMIAFLVFVVAGSSLFQVISSLMDPKNRTD